MYSTRNLAPTCALSLLLFACSSSGKGSQKDAGPIDSGMTIDTNLTAMDGGHPLDVRDTATLGEAQPRLDVPIAIDTSDAPKTGDTRDGVSAIDGVTSLDSQDAGKPSDAKDATNASDAIDAPRIADAADAPKTTDATKDKAAVDITPPPNSCENPINIPPGQAHVDIAISTDGETHDFDLPCATGGNDVVLYFYLNQTELVYADTFGATWNTILAFSPTCPITTPTQFVGVVGCNDDACATSQSQVYAILDYGPHYLVVSGANGESGSVTVHFQHAPVANSVNDTLAAGSGVRTGITTDRGVLSLCEAGGPEDCYWWASCPDYAGGDFTASTCTGTSFDTVLSLQIPRSEAVLCANGDSCGLQESIATTIPPGAGIHVLAVDGDVGISMGAYTLTYTRP
jgi:hypothetical protein